MRKSKFLDSALNAILSQEQFLNPGVLKPYPEDIEIVSFSHVGENNCLIARAPMSMRFYELRNLGDETHILIECYELKSHREIEVK